MFVQKRLILLFYRVVFGGVRDRAEMLLVRGMHIRTEYYGAVCRYCIYILGKS